jgi:8-oxo-dGTP pyrophosphatase MutT (NUDIX family)
MDIGEIFAQPVIREVREEAGFDIRIDRIIGIYSDLGHVFATMTAKCGGNSAFARCPSTPRRRTGLPNAQLGPVRIGPRDRTG